MHKAVRQWAYETPSVVQLVTVFKELEDKLKMPSSKKCYEKLCNNYKTEFLVDKINFKRPK